MTNANLTLPSKRGGNDMERMEVAMLILSSVTSTAPLGPLMHVWGLSERLAKLPANCAKCMEAWMSAVNAFPSMKSADEKKN